MYDVTILNVYNELENTFWENKYIISIFEIRSEIHRHTRDKTYFITLLLYAISNED